MHHIRSAILIILLISASTRADVAPPPPVVTPADVIQRVGIDQKIGQQIPLDLVFNDEDGNSVRLAQFFNGKPVVLSLVYYKCPMLCTMTLNGMLGAFKSLGPDIGKDYQVVTISFDPREKPPLAAEKKQNYLRQYGRDGAQAGWHFLTGNPDQIDALTRAVGFRYFFDEKSDQFAHAAGIMVATPTGVLSRYFYGLEYSPRDLQLGLVEASAGKVGTLTDRVLLLCYHYDPMTGKYGFAIMSALRIAAVLTILAIGSFIMLSLRRERKGPLTSTQAPQ